jgi:hypothetical protein
MLMKVPALQPEFAATLFLPVGKNCRWRVATVIA